MLMALQQASKITHKIENTILESLDENAINQLAAEAISAEERLNEAYNAVVGRQHAT